MANRRMFARSVTGSGRFLRLSVQSKVLYFDLGMEADDDGFVEAYARLLVTGSREEHLAELEQAGFITVCDWENLVVYIRDWKRNNLIRADRYTPSIYRECYAQVMDEVEKSAPAPCPVQRQEKPEPIAEAKPETAAQPENREESTRQEDGCFLGDSRLTQVRSGKDRLEKDRLEEGSAEQVSSNQDNFMQSNSEKKRSETWYTRAREAESEKTASPKAGEAEIDFVKKRQFYLDLLMNSKLLQSTRASPGSLLAV